MPMKYKVLPEHKLLFGVFFGALTAGQFVKGIEDISVNPDFRPDFDRLAIHHPTLDLSCISFDDIVGFRDTMIRAYYNGRPPAATDLPMYRIAVVSRVPMNQKMARLYGATLNTGMPSPIAIEIFQTLEDALSWLGRDGLVATFRKADWQAFMTPDPVA